MSILGSFVKQPAEYIDYDIDYSKWLEASETISSQTTTATAGITVSSSINGSGKITKTWVSGGLNGSTYKVTVMVTTSIGRIKESEFYIRSKEY